MSSEDSFFTNHYVSPEDNEVRGIPRKASRCSMFRESCERAVDRLIFSPTTYGSEGFEEDLQLAILADHKKYLWTSKDPAIMLRSFESTIKSTSRWVAENNFGNFIQSKHATVPVVGEHFKVPEFDPETDYLNPVNNADVMRDRFETARQLYEENEEKNLQAYNNKLNKKVEVIRKTRSANDIRNPYESLIHEHARLLMDKHLMEKHFVNLREYASQLEETAVTLFDSCRKDVRISRRNVERQREAEKGVRFLYEKEQCQLRKEYAERMRALEDNSGIDINSQHVSNIKDINDTNTLNEANLCSNPTAHYCNESPVITDIANESDGRYVKHIGYHGIAAAVVSDYIEPFEGIDEQVISITHPDSPSRNDAGVLERTRHIEDEVQSGVKDGYLIEAIDKGDQGYRGMNVVSTKSIGLAYASCSSIRIMQSCMNLAKAGKESCANEKDNIIATSQADVRKSRLPRPIRPIKQVNKPRKSPVAGAHETKHKRNKATSLIPRLVFKQSSVVSKLKEDPVFLPPTQKKQLPTLRKSSSLPVLEKKTARNFVPSGRIGKENTDLRNFNDSKKEFRPRPRKSLAQLQNSHSAPRLRVLSPATTSHVAVAKTSADTSVRRRSILPLQGTVGRGNALKRPQLLPPLLDKEFNPRNMQENQISAVESSSNLLNRRQQQSPSVIGNLQTDLRRNQKTSTVSMDEKHADALKVVVIDEKKVNRPRRRQSLPPLKDIEYLPKFLDNSSPSSLKPKPRRRQSLPPLKGAEFFPKRLCLPKDPKKSPKKIKKIEKVNEERFVARPLTAFNRLSNKRSNPKIRCSQSGPIYPNLVREKRQAKPIEQGFVPTYSVHKETPPKRRGSCNRLPVGESKMEIAPRIDMSRRVNKLLPINAACFNSTKNSETEGQNSKVSLKESRHFVKSADTSSGARRKEAISSPSPPKTPRKTSVKSTFRRRMYISEKDDVKEIPYSDSKDYDIIEEKQCYNRYGFKLRCAKNCANSKYQIGLKSPHPPVTPKPRSPHPPGTLKPRLPHPPDTPKPRLPQLPDTPKPRLPHLPDMPKPLLPHPPVTPKPRASINQRRLPCSSLQPDQSSCEETEKNRSFSMDSVFLPETRELERGLQGGFEQGELQSNAMPYRRRGIIKTYSSRSPVEYSARKVVSFADANDSSNTDTQKGYLTEKVIHQPMNTSLNPIIRHLQTEARHGRISPIPPQDFENNIKTSTLRKENKRCDQYSSTESKCEILRRDDESGVTGSDVLDNSDDRKRGFVAFDIFFDDNANEPQDSGVQISNFSRNMPSFKLSSNTRHHSGRRNRSVKHDNASRERQ